jgi:hypothetical protein
MPIVNTSIDIQSEDIKLFNAVLKMPLVKLPITTSLITVPTGKILLSPHPSMTITELQSMGNITDIVAPNLFHHLGIQNAVAAHPTAKLWSTKGLEEKRKDIIWGDFLAENTWPYQEELITINIAGVPKINEFLFLHKKSKTLFVTDFCFNILDDSGFGGWLLYNIFGTYKRFAISKIFIKSIANKESFQEFLKTLFSFEFDNIVMSHGYNIKGEGKAKLRAALEDHKYFIR